MLAMTFALTTLAGCGKKASPKPFDNDPIATRTLRYLTQAAWKETKLEYKTSGNAWTPVTLSATALAEITTFDKNGTFTVTEANGATSGGMWQIIGDNTQLAINRTTTYNFAMLSDTVMQLELTGEIPYADPVTNRTTVYYGMRETFGH